MRSAQARLLLLTALIVLAIFAVLLQRHGDKRAVKLEDGREVRLRTISFGKRHPVFTGPAWTRPVARILPTNFAARLGVRDLTGTTTNEALVAWVEWRLGTNRAPYPVYGSIVDSRGLESLRVMSKTLVNLTNRALAGFTFSSLPRSSRTIQVRVIEAVAGSDWRVVADFEVSNPAYTANDALAGDPLPQTRTVHDTEFTLLAFNTGLFATLPVAWHVMSNQCTELIFRVGTNVPGMLGTNPAVAGAWRATRVQIADSAGNLVIDKRDPQGRIVWQTDKQFMSRNDDGMVLLPGGVWPDQPWKIRVDFARAPKDFPAGNRCTFTEIPVPKPGSSVILARTCEVRGARITVNGLQQAPSLEGDPRRQVIVTARECTMRVSFEPGREEWELHGVHVKDQAGREFGVSTPRGASGRRREQLFNFRIAPDSTELEAVFAVGKPYVAEFLATPTVLRTNVAYHANR